MKTKSLFWGLFLITLGSLYLLESYTSMDIGWHYILDWWALIFIFWGLCVIFKNNASIRPVVTGVTGFWLALIIYAFFMNVMFYGIDYDFDFDSCDDYTVQNYTQAFDRDIEESKLIINGGAGKFIIKGSTTDLVTAKAHSSFGDYDYDYYDKGDRAILEISHSDTHIDLFDFDDDLRNRLEVKLNRNPVWDLDLNIGAASTVLDLSNHKVKYLDLNTGASKTRIKLSDLYDETEVDVEMGAASLIFDIPKNSGCKITGDMVLMFKTLDGFIKKGNNNKYYVTENFNSADSKILINVEGGVSSIKVYRN